MEPLREATPPVTVGDRVSFEVRNQHYHGEVRSLGPKRALVDAGGRGQWRVPYGALKRRPDAINAGREREQWVRERAHELMQRHELFGWRFEFDGAKRRAGVCRYTDRTIRMAVEYAHRASPEHIHDTLLHEIAHALVGPGHGHDRVWRECARRIGCTARRCHSFSFTRAKWIARCPRGCFEAERHRRVRGGVCAKCKSRVEYRENSALASSSPPSPSRPSPHSPSAPPPPRSPCPPSASPPPALSPRSSSSSLPPPPPFSLQ